MTQNFNDLVAGDVVQSLDLESAIVMLWSLEGDRILAASPSAIRLFGGFKSEDLTGRRFGPALPSTARLAELSRYLAVGEPARVERLRFFLGSRSDVLTCLCQRVRLKTDGEALLVISKDHRHVHSRRSSLVSVVPEEAGNQPIEPAASAPEAPEAEVIAAPQMSQRPVRFVFQMDPGGRIQSVSPQLGQAVGDDNAAIVGCHFAELESTLRVEGSNQLARLIEAGQGWQGVEVRWPTATGATVIPVELSGLPIRNASRDLVGFRGFGLVRLDLPAVPAIAPPKPQVDDEPVTAMTFPADAPEPSDAAISNIVTLNPGPSKPALEIVPPVPAIKFEKHADDRLSQSERNAFREIAKALGARLADDMPEPPGHQRRDDVQKDAPEQEKPEATNAEAVWLAPAFVPPAPFEYLLQTPTAVAVEPDDRQAMAQNTTLEEPLAMNPGSNASHTRDQQPGTTETVNENAETTDELSKPVSISVEEPEDLDAASAFEMHTAARLDVFDDQNGFTLIDRLPIGVVIMQDQSPVFMNRTLLGLLNLDEVPSDEDTHAPVFAEPLDLDRVTQAPIETSLRTQDGEMVAVLAVGEPISWRGEPALLVSMRRAASASAIASLSQNADTSEALGLRQDLRTAETERDEFKAILDTATDGVISLDTEGRIIGLNRSAEALFGFDQNEVVGQRFSTLFAGESHASALDYLEGLKSGGVASVLNDGREVVGREKKGGRIPLFMTLGRISDRDGGRYCAVLRDLTAWKKAEAELTESKRVAERASAMKSDFLAKISHEIRTPMNAIIGFSEVMRTEQFGPIGSERYREYLGDIHRSGEHVISLVNDLLDLSKIEAGRADLAFTSVNLNDIVQDCISMMQPQATRERVIMRCNLVDNLPSVVADERSIKQVVLNLLSNACKFNQPGGQVIISTAMSDEGEAVIRVRDTGIGMSEKDIEGAMQPFRQMSPTRRGGGTGLGLPLSKALVEANRANLAIRSAVNEGTLAEVTFPATRVLAE